MARQKKGKQDPVELKKAKWQGFVNVYLKSQEKEAIKANPLCAEDALIFLADLCQAGYKVGLSWTPSGEYWNVSATGQYEERPNAGWCMSMKHSDILIAITALHWCHEAAGLNGEWADRFTTATGNDW